MKSLMVAIARLREPPLQRGASKGSAAIFLQAWLQQLTPNVVTSMTGFAEAVLFVGWFTVIVVLGVVGISAVALVARASTATNESASNVSGQLKAQLDP